jgi:hypothetical protein
LEHFHSLNLAKSAQVTRIRKDDWNRAAEVVQLQIQHNRRRHPNLNLHLCNSGCTFTVTSNLNGIN